MSASSSRAVTTRSAYVAKLRKAFLLRVHPDRFRSSDDSIRKGQARLLQALNNRMSLSDFKAYSSGMLEKQHPQDFVSAMGSSNHFSSRPAGRGSTSGSDSEGSVHSYVIEHRDGTLLQETIELNDSVEKILVSMVRALQVCGAGFSIPRPPPPPPSPSVDKFLQNGMLWAPPSSGPASTTNSHRSIDHRFDIHTKKGKDFFNFIQCLHHEEVNERKFSRMDANAAALVTRRLFQFQAVDGSSLHWSSKSFAMLLASLIELHEEHKNKLFVTSFYPLRLVFTPEDVLMTQMQNPYTSNEQQLDIYGGVLLLNPGCTPIQWLTTLRQVTDDKLDQLRTNQKRLLQSKTIIEEELRVKIKKGFTCSSAEYFQFIMNLASYIHDNNNNNTVDNNNSKQKKLEKNSEGDKSLALESILVIVESSTTCRKPMITQEGNIRIGTMFISTGGKSMLEQIQHFIKQNQYKAREKMEHNKQEKEVCKELIKHIQIEYGLSKIYRTSTSIVSYEQFKNCLLRLLQLDTTNKLQLKASLCSTGVDSLGITTNGQFCHLADDGSVIIPVDWK